jgi:hypothetical protein
VSELKVIMVHLGSRLHGVSARLANAAIIQNAGHKLDKNYFN